MTLVVAWVRAHGGVEELVIAADSRLRSCGAWDAGPKIFPLARGDCALAFAGSTGIAYPFYLQVANAISMHRGSRNRYHDIVRMKNHILQVMNAMFAEFDGRDHPGNLADLRETKLYFGGWSWRTQRFRAWTISYEFGKNAFVFRSMGTVGTGRVAVIGDPAQTDADRRRLRESRDESPVKRSEDVVVEARRRLAHLAAKIKPNAWDMEPLFVVRDMIREAWSPAVGGPLQLAKIYAHCNAQAAAVIWTDKKGRRATLLGRPLLWFERQDVPVLDPDTLELSTKLWKTLPSTPPQEAE